MAMKFSQSLKASLLNASVASFPSASVQPAFSFLLNAVLLLLLVGQLLAPIEKPLPVIQTSGRDGDNHESCPGPQYPANVNVLMDSM